jgi:hypothetical protein
MYPSEEDDVLVVRDDPDLPEYSDDRAQAMAELDAHPDVIGGGQ